MRVVLSVLLVSVRFDVCGASSSPGGGGYYPGGYRPPQQRGYPQQHQQPYGGNHPMQHQYGGQPQQQQQGVYPGQQQQQQHHRVQTEDEAVTNNTPSTSRLPEPWQEHKDPSSGKFYYYNPSNGVTQWDRPVDEATVASSTAAAVMEEETTNLDVDNADPVESLHVELLLASEEAMESASLNSNLANTADNIDNRMLTVEDVTAVVAEEEMELKMVNDKESVVDDDETDRLVTTGIQKEVGEQTIVEEEELKGQQQIEGTMIGTATNQGEEQYYRQEQFQPGNMQQRIPGPTGQWNSGWQPPQQQQQQQSSSQSQQQQPPSFQGGEREGGGLIETLASESQLQSPPQRQQQQQQQQQQPSQQQQMQHQWQQPPSQQKQQMSPPLQQQPRQPPGAGYGLGPPGWQMRHQPQHLQQSGPLPQQQMLPGQPRWGQQPPLQSQQQSQLQQQQSIPSKPAFGMPPQQQQQQQFPPTPYQGYTGGAGPPRYPGQQQQQQQQQYPPPYQGYYDPYYGSSGHLLLRVLEQVN